MSVTAQPRSGIVTVLRVTGGNFLETFGFFLFGFYATSIAKAFLPAGSDFTSLMLTFMTSGAGFFMRPWAPSSSAPMSTGSAAARV